MAVPAVTFDRLVAALDDEAWSDADFRGYVQFMSEVSNVRRLIEAVDGGLELSPRAVRDACKLGSMTTVGALYFREHQGFTDDFRFTPTRFAMVFEFHKARLPHDMTVIQAAGRQVERMLLAGRMSPVMDYVSAYWSQVNAHIMGGGDAGLLSPLVAHYYDVRQVMEARVAAAAANGRGTGSNSDETYDMMAQEARAAITAGLDLRDEVFRDYWLRAALNRAEWGEARTLAAEVLRELYADVWAEGYAGYHRRLAAKPRVGIL